MTNLLEFYGQKQGLVLSKWNLPFNNSPIKDTNIIMSVPEAECINRNPFKIVFLQIKHKTSKNLYCKEKSNSKNNERLVRDR